MFDYASFLAAKFPEVGYREFYRDIFPSGSLQQNGGSHEKGKYPAIAVIVRASGNLRYTVNDDLSTIDRIVADARPGDLCVMSPVSYAGMSQRKSMAHALYAFAFDLDGLIVEDERPLGLEQLFYQAGPILETPAVDFAIPKPTYIVASGTGLHFYYVLGEPLVLWPAVIQRVEEYRRCLTRKLWNRYVTDLWKSVQFEGSTQGFRMIGTPVKPQAGSGLARAFKSGEQVSIEYMDRFVPEESRIGVEKPKADTVPIDEAKELWPEWYENRIVKGVPRATWRNKRELYDWWKRRVLAEGTPGHRYNCIVALAAYAKKCGIEHDELARDAEELREVLNSRDAQNPFTTKDVSDALTAYRPGMVRYPINEIVMRTGISIEKNKRNGRKQSLHLKIARSNLAILNEDSGHNLQGRKPKRDLVRSYAVKHPEASQREIAAALGISKTTVNKWLKPGWREEWEEDHASCITGHAPYIKNGD